MHHTEGREVPQQVPQLLCLDLLLEFIKHMATRAEGVSASVALIDVLQWC